MTKACYVCGRVEYGTTMVMECGYCIDLCTHCACKGIREIAETGILTRWPLEIIVLHAIATSDPPSFEPLCETLQMNSIDAMWGHAKANAKGYVADLKLTDKGLAKLNKWKNKEGMP